MPLAPGLRFGHYEILSPLGAGGMGEVFKAKDTRLGREVALKILRPDALANPDRKQRFLREAQATSALNHPNIVVVYEVGAEDGIDFIAMELVRGKTLDQIIPRKGLRCAEALKYGVAIADALAKAHGAGVVHRDLKPGNIMVNDDGHVKVLDFGLAKLVETSPIGAEEATRTVREHTRDGAILGTISYMSPEQAEGKPVDARSDIFSFGGVLYEMLTSRRPFQGASNMSTLAAIIKERPKPVRELNPETPVELERIINRCLQKDPARRFQHMDDLKIALEEVGAEFEQESRGPAAFTSKMKSQRISSAAVASLVLIAVTAVGLYMVSRIRQPLKPSPGSAVVILMDTPAPMGVYDPRTRNDSGSNADDINNILRDLPVVLHKESVGALWNREDQVLKQSPDLIVIHRSAFFHSMNLEFQFGYPPFRESEEVLMPSGQRVARQYLFELLYAQAMDKLAAFLGYVGAFSSRTKILAYSRGDPGGWGEEVYRRDWVANIERRFPSLKGRVFTISVEGGIEKATFRDPQTAAMVKREVRSILGMNSLRIGSGADKR